VSLMPIFSDLVLSNESALKEHLRLIFLDISEAITKGNVGGTASGSGKNELSMGDSSGGEF